MSEEKTVGTGISFRDEWDLSRSRALKNDKTRKLRRAVSLPDELTVNAGRP